MDRNARSKIIWQAEALERRSKKPGKRNGDLGQTGLQVLRALLFRFAPNPTPTYDQIKAHTKLCLQTIADAITRLELAGIVQRHARRVRTALGIRIAANGYSFPSPPLFDRSLKESKDSKLVSAKSMPFVAWSEWQSPLKIALEELGRRLGAPVPT